MSEATIWQKLKAKGLSDTAVAAVMGNMKGESGLIPYRVQGDFGDGYEWSKIYTAEVDSGEISKAGFLYEGPCGGGYGLCQWTFWSRKEGLYDTAKRLGLSIGDEQVAADWFYAEIQEPQRKVVWDDLHSNKSLYDMTVSVLVNYEKPYDQSQRVRDQRTAWAQEIYDRNAGTAPAPEPTPEPEPTPVPTPIYTCTITAPVLKKGDKDTSKGGDKGVTVSMLQKGIEKNGISLGSWGCDGDFGSATENAVKKFQQKCNITVDGVVGHDTWQILFQ